MAMPSEPLQRLRPAMVAALRADRAHVDEMVARLEVRWDDFIAAAFKGAERYDALHKDLLATVGRDREPATMPVSLLGVAASTHTETCHTATLRRLLDPSEAVTGDLGLKLLRALLRMVDGAPEVPSDLLAQATLDEPEWIDPDTGKARYPDLVIDIPTTSLPICIVVENKIGHRDTEGQLDDYARLATARCAGDVFCVFLTPEERPPQLATKPHLWQRLGYRELALGWRRVLAGHHVDDAWAWTLRLYLASVVQDIIGIRLDEHMSLAERATVIDYLEAALDRTP